MKQRVTQGIVLSRTNYGEADRIITVLTPGDGKLRLMAKGVRRVKSKLAGGIELFSVTDITYIPGKKEIGTLISSRLFNHYGRIIEDIDRVQLGYDLIKLINLTTEDKPGGEYFILLQDTFIALNANDIDNRLIKTWFEAQLLKLAGHAPNLRYDNNRGALKPMGRYSFDFEAMSFYKQSEGTFDANSIRAMRLLFSSSKLTAISRINGLEQTLKEIGPLIHNLMNLSYN